MSSKPPPIPLTTALTRLVQLGEYELSSPACPNPPPMFHRELEQAVKTTRAFLAEIRPPAGQFFTSAEQRPHKLK